MESCIGKICPFCKTEIKEGDSVKICPVCGIPHHERCWGENNGCATPGCSEQHRQSQEINPTNVCSNCGATLVEGKAFCPNCGQKVGQTVDAGSRSAANQFNSGRKRPTLKNKNNPLIIGIAIAAVVIVIILIVALSGGSKGPDFEKLYNQYCTSTWADVGSDGSYLTIDTNPYDNDDDGLAYPAAYTAIKEVNTALGLPESLIDEMGRTTGADGKQTETFEEQGVTVSWRYHPDRGLEVTYKKAN